MPNAPLLSRAALRVLALTALWSSLPANEVTAGEGVLPPAFAADTALTVGDDAFVGGTLPGDLSTVTAALAEGLRGQGWTAVAPQPPAPTGGLAYAWTLGARSVRYVLEPVDPTRLGLTLSDSRAAPSATSGGEERPE